jgi:two-component system repressor protein LuxO
MIAEFFLNRYAREETKYFEGFDVEAKRRLLEYHWPGNVRELQNVIRNVVVLNEGGEVTVADFPAPLNSLQDIAATVVVKKEEPEEPQTSKTAKKSKPYSKVMAQSLDEIEPLEVLERKIIENAVKLCKGNVPKAAALLEVSPSTLYRKIKGWS